MSTHAIVSFYPAGTDIGIFEYPDPESAVYVHHDGYPRGLGQDLANFLKTPEAEQFNLEPTFMAGAFIVWKTQRIREARAETRAIRGSDAPTGLEHFALGPVCEPAKHGADYFYHVICNSPSEVFVDGVWDPRTQQDADPLLSLEMALEIDSREVVR